MSSSVQCAADQNFGASCVLSNVNCGISMCSDLCAGGTDVCSICAIFDDVPPVSVSTCMCSTCNKTVGRV